jgi:hypothetical protein
MRPLRDPGPGLDPGSYRRAPGVPGNGAPGLDTRDRGARGGRRRRAAPPRAARWWGTRSGQFGVLLLLGFAAVGAAVTIGRQSEPGVVLDGFVLAGTAVAALIVRPRAVHVIIPMPALAYLVAASVAGLIHDRAVDTSRTALIASATQWFASGFIAMAAATVLAIAITAARWAAGRGPG